MLDPSELIHFQALRQQAGGDAAKEAIDQIIAEAVTRRAGESARQHLTRFQQVDKDALSIDQLLELNSHKGAIEQGVQREKREVREREANASASSTITPPVST